MIRIFRYRITTQNLPASLGSFLTAQGYSRSMILGFKHHGGVTVNGKLRRIIDPLQSGDLVEIHAQDTTGSLQPNPDLDLPILYEDQDLLLLNKPDNMLIHPAGLGFDDAVGNFFAARYPNTTFRPIGRLDRHTSGISLIAKNRLTAAQLTAMPPHKCYYAIAEGQIQTQTGRIEAPLLRLPGSQISHAVDSAGKPSITNFRVLAQNETHTWLKLELETGRTHQIRVHLQYIGHPLAGDTLYGGSSDLIQRQALHCGEISFCHPQSGHIIHVTAPLPEDMARLLAIIKPELD